MKRVLLLAVLSGGCATAPTPPQTTPARYQADVTYTMSAAAIEALAESGEDVRLTFRVGSGGESVTSCTAVPVAAAKAPSLASRLSLAH